MNTTDTNNVGEKDMTAITDREQEKNHLRWILSTYRMVYDGIIDGIGENKKEADNRLEHIRDEIMREKGNM